MREFTPGIAAILHLGADAAHDAKALQPHQEGAEHACRYDKAERWQDADPLANDDETGNFQKWKREKKKRYNG